MKIYTILKRKQIGIFCFLVLAACSKTPVSTELTQYVDPDIGGVGHLLQPTRPTVQLPNQMIRMYPLRKDYLDDQISGFPLTLSSHRQSTLFKIMPFTGELTEKSTPVSAWDKQNEKTTPYFYSVWLEDFNTDIEFTPGAKTGYYRINFPSSSSSKIYLEANNGEWHSESENIVSGIENFSGMRAFVYGIFNTPFTEDKTTDSNKLILSFSNKTIEFKYAISFISEEQAKKNLETELPAWGFDKQTDVAKQKWENVLGQIEVKGGTEARKRTFYTALYRCYERMINIMEDSKYYSNYDSDIHEDSRPFYVDDWIWDTYLAHHPLRAILDPDIESDMMASYVRMYEQSEWLPQFCLLTGEIPCMNGFHSTITFLDNYRKGIKDFDIERAYEGMKKNALEGTMLPWRTGAACKLDKKYHELGYYPALHPGEEETEPMVHSFEKRQAVAVTLGHSYDDWALGQFASTLGKKDDAMLFSEKANNYKNLYWKEKGFFMPKDISGNWINIDPKFDGGMGGRDYYDENNGWTYLWQVQHDIPGLIELMGGKENFEDRLDQLFREGLDRSKYATWAKFPDFSGIVGQFSMGNEPSFHIPYLYNLTDSPWKTQKKIRMLLDAWFPDNIFGIPGDEDGGGMSAFVVFSCMGFYPITPGLPIYTIGSPMFEEITINLDNGKKFHIVTEGFSENNKYIQNAWLNGEPLNSPWFTHEDIIHGGELKLEMGQRPNKEWGTDTSKYEELVSTYSKK